MPKIKFDHVVSFSSEDPVHVASNVLNSDPAKKWLSRIPGETSISLIVQLEKAEKISNIDVGSEYSAYVEILVGRSLTSTEFKSFLVMSSFMTPLDSHKGTNINKVRMFKYNEFQKSIRDEKWDRFKIICTQPFNRHVQYGIAFITFYSPSDNADSLPLTNRNMLDISPTLTLGNLFTQKKITVNEPLTAAAEIRAAEKGAVFNKVKLDLPSFKKEINPRNRVELMYSKDEKVYKQSEDTINKNEQPTKQTNNQTGTYKVNPMAGASTSQKRNIDYEEAKTRKKCKKKILTKPFNSLLEGVTVVISGIENPIRSYIRTKALTLGAKYKANWDNSCTHLICAFTNTPKFKEVKGKGKIITRSWIEDCYSQRKRLPWRRYALDPSDKSQDESEPEILEQTEAMSSDEEVNCHLNKNVLPVVKEDKDPYSADTDEEIYFKPELPELLKLPNFFSNKVFYIDPNLDKADKTLLMKYITAFKGLVSEVLNDVVNFVMTSKDHVPNLREKDCNAKLVSPDWIWKCHNERQLTDVTEFLLK